MRRVLGVVTAAMGAIFIATQTTMAAVTWASPSIVGTTHTYNGGMSLARSTTTTTSYLHSVYANTYPGGVASTDTGPYVGVYYSRGNSSGTTWGTPKRLNPSDQHAAASAIVANGKILYAAYVTYGHWADYDPAEARPIILRINSSHGASGSWLERILEFGERVDRPALSPWGSAGVAIVYTDAETGNIILVTCGDLTVEDSGCAAGSVGTTTRMASDEADGYEGLPVVSASGGTMAVAWLSGDSGITAVTGEPFDFGTPKVVTTAPADGLSAAAKGSRFAFSWAEDAGVKVRFWTSGVWRAPHTVYPVTSTSTYKYVYTTAVSLASTSTVGVAYAACRRADCTASSTTGVDLRFRQSSDNAVSWATGVTVASYSAASTRRINDAPSLVMSSSTKRFLMYNTMSSGGGSYRVWLRVGTG
jgi:hypothetical protein